MRLPNKSPSVSTTATSSKSNAIVLAVATCSCLTAATAYFFYKWHKHVLSTQEEEWRRRRQEEQKGRIRAEARLRKIMKEKSLNDNERSAEKMQNNDEKQPQRRVVIHSIGTTKSPYTKRTGTPRQPHFKKARAYRTDDFTRRVRWEKEGKWWTFAMREDWLIPGALLSSMWDGTGNFLYK